MFGSLRSPRASALHLHLSCAVLFAAACGTDATGGGDGGGSRDGGGPGADSSVARDAGRVDGGRPNPLGLGPAPIELGVTTDLASAGSYVLLAKTGITDVTGSSISGGHVGLSPAAASFVTGFALVAHSTNEYATSSTVVSPWRIYASDYAPPTPSNLTTAILDMEDAYRDGAGRSGPDFLDLSGGDLSGLTLAPGLYTWGTGVTIPDDVTIAGAASDVWIFQIANDLDLSAATNVTLGGAAQARNVFWVVAGAVTIHADAHFEGVILCSTAITLQTGASLHGRALAQTLVALDDNDITAP
jgi:hypothetical protein